MMATNIEHAIKDNIDFYFSFPEADSPYAKDKFIYDEENNQYTCPEEALKPGKKAREAISRGRRSSFSKISILYLSLTVRCLFFLDIKLLLYWLMVSPLQCFVLSLYIIHWIYHESIFFMPYGI